MYLVELTPRGIRSIPVITKLDVRVRLVVDEHMNIVSLVLLLHVFFFSSRRRHTRLQGDWSSDVCSSDLGTSLERYVFDAYGSATVLAGNWTSKGSSSYSWTYLHQGGRLDPITGLSDFRNQIGRASCRGRV